MAAWLGPAIGAIGSIAGGLFGGGGRSSQKIPEPLDWSDPRYGEMSDIVLDEMMGPGYLDTISRLGKGGAQAAHDLYNLYKGSTVSGSMGGQNIIGIPKAAKDLAFLGADANLKGYTWQDQAKMDWLESINEMMQRDLERRYANQGYSMEENTGFPFKEVAEGVTPLLTRVLGKTDINIPSTPAWDPGAGVGFLDDMRMWGSQYE